METEETKLKAATDFVIWLAFVCTILATILLIATGTYHILQGNTDALYHFAASIVTLGLHYGIRRL